MGAIIPSTDKAPTTLETTAPFKGLTGVADKSSENPSGSGGGTIIPITDGASVTDISIRQNNGITITLSSSGGFFIRNFKESADGRGSLTVTGYLENASQLGNILSNVKCVFKTASLSLESGTISISDMHCIGLSVRTVSFGQTSAILYAVNFEFAEAEG